MPIYEYQCQNCGYLFEELQTMSEAPLVTCPNCGKDELKKLIGSGGGIIFKGSGFYQTDYKKSASDAKEDKTEKVKGQEKSEVKTTEKSGEKSESTGTKTDSKSSKPETKSESSSKPEVKKDSKPSPKSQKKK